MDTTDPSADQLPLHPEIGYEHSDISTRSVAVIGIGILLGTWIFVMLLYFFFDYLMRYRAEAGPPAPARASARAVEPPQPRIEASPSSDLARFRLFEDAQLHSYQWVDQSKGVVRIPIDRAIEITAQRGIPAQRVPQSLKLYPPQAGTRMTGFEGQVEPEPR
jgi:hypothetical protein